MSLADELLADLEEGGEEEVEQTDGDIAEAIPNVEDVGEVDMDTQDALTSDCVKNVAKLRDSDQVIFYYYCV